MRALLPMLLFGWKSLLARRLQSFLLFFAFTVAYGSAGTVLALLESLERRIADDLAGIGWNIINVHPPPDLKLILQSLLEPALLDELAALTGGQAAGAALETLLLTRGEARQAVLAVGTSPAWAAAAELKFTSGGFFKEGELDACVLDEWVARQLCGDAPAVGQTIHAAISGRSVPLRVAGVATDPFRIRKQLGGLDGGAAATAAWSCG